MHALPSLAEPVPDAKEALRSKLIQAVARRRSFPQSPAQRRLWVLSQLQPESAAYNLSFAWPLNGAIDAARLEASVNDVIARHEVLRTVFSQVSGAPQQAVLPTLKLKLPVRSLEGAAEGTLEAELSRLARLPFDLGAGPLLRTALFRLGPERQVLGVVVHHIVFDAASGDVLLGEIAQCYAARARGAKPDLPAVSLQYQEYAVEQARLAEAGGHARQLDFWRKSLGGLEADLRLAALDHGSDDGSPAGAVETLTLSPEVSARLREASREQKTTLFAYLLAVYQALLARYTGEADICVGIPVTNRHGARFAQAIGFYVNTLPIRTLVDGAQGFRTLARAVHNQLAASFQNQDVPFEEIVSALRPDRRSVTPFFQVMFHLERGGAGASDAGGQKPIDVDSGAAKFPLTLRVADLPTGLVLRANYRTGCFGAAFIREFLRRFAQLASAVAHDPGRPLREADLFLAGERATVRETWNATTAPVTDATVATLFEEQARQRPGKVAVTVSARDGSLTPFTYGEIARRSAALARQLRALGVGPDAVVALRLERSVEMIVGILGVLRAGGAYLPIDPTYPEERVSFVLADSAATVLLTQRKFGGPADYRGTVLRLDELTPDDLGPEVAGGPAPGDLAYVIYTSGSTGTPKGAMNEHRGLTNRLQWMAAEYGVNESDVILQKTPYTFDVSVWELILPLITGATLCFLAPGGEKDPDEILRVVAQAGVTTLHFVPSMLAAFLQQIPAHSAFTRVRRCICSGEALAPEHATAFHAQTAGQVELHNLYGPTEASIDVTYHAVQPGSRLVPIGRPVWNTRLYVVGEGDRLVPPGFEGELLLGGVQLGRGYLNRPELTAERFVPFAEEPSGRVYRTGDLTKWLRNGEVQYVRRIDHQIKLRGFRIELGEIETALAACPGVKQAAVQAIKSEAGATSLCAYVVGAGPATPAAWRDALRRKLPEYMVPAHFVTLDALPLSPNGKLDRRALPKPALDDAAADQAYVAPRTLVEETLATIWARVLGLKAVSVTANFFELGGDSILGIQAIGAAKAVGLPYPLEALFNHPTIEALARHAPGAEAVPAVAEPFALVAAEDRARLPAGLEDAYPVTTLQLGMLYHSRLHANSPVYHDVFSRHLRFPFVRERFEEALAGLIERHEILRTSFSLADFSQPMQRVHRTVPLPLAIDDLRPLDPAAQEAAIRDWFSRETTRDFDFDCAPLFRIQLHLRSPEAFQLTLSFHHAILDGWSVATMMTELLGRYRSLVETGVVPPLKPKGHFRDHVARETELLTSADSGAFWQAELGGRTFTKPAPLPDGFLARHAPGPDQRVVPLPDALAESLHALARKLSVPVKSVLLAAHLRTLAHLTGQRQVLSGLVANGRAEEPGAENVLGLFLNTLPFGLELTAENWESLIGRVFRQELRFLPHRRFPIAELNKRFGIERFIEVVFNYNKFHVAAAAGGGDAGPAVVAGQTHEQTNYPLLANFVADPNAERVTLTLKSSGAAGWAWRLEALAECYLEVMREMVANPQHPIGGIRALAADQARLAGWIGRAEPPATDDTLVSLFDAQVERAPGREAVAFPVTGYDAAGMHVLTYAELGRRAEALARHLRADGVGRGSIVALLLERSPEMIIGILGILKAGAAYLPLDPRLPQARLDYQLHDSGAARLLTQARFSDRAPAGVPTLRLDEFDFAAESPPPACEPVRPDDGAYVIYTSGTTGRPKGVLVAHRGVVNRLRWMQDQFPITPADRFLQKTPYTFDVSVWELLMPLTAGAKLCFLRPGAEKKPEEIVDAVAAAGVTILHFVPSMLSAFLRHLEDPGRLRSVRYCACSGEALTVDQKDLFFRQTGGGIRLVNLYGPTEASIEVTSYEAQPDDPVIPIGRPIWHTTLEILDPAGQPVPVGTTGELCIGGIPVAEGYLNRPELTADRFVRGPGCRLYRTGDLARWLPNGEIQCLGRIDHQVKIRGFRIELEEIEAVLGRAPGVRCAAAKVHRETDADDPVLCGYAVLEPGAELNAVQAHLVAHLPEYMVPTFLVPVAEMPLSPSGKTDRQALPDPKAHWRPETAYVAAANLEEEKMVAVWRRVLRRGSIGQHDRFFELGGHSLLALTLTEHIRKAFGAKLSIRDVFEHPTPRALLRVLRAHAAPPAPVLTPAPIAESYPVTPQQKRLYVLQAMNRGTAAYNIPQIFIARDRLDPARVSAAVATLVRRHESLRTRFLMEGDRLVQRVDPVGEIPVETGELALAELDVLLKRFIRPFDLAAGPLLRVGVFALDDGTTALCFDLHHIVADGISLERFLVDFIRAYAGAELPPPRLQYKDYAVWWHESGQAAIEAERRYWLSEFAAGVPPMELPTDFPRPKVLSYEGSRCFFEFDPTLTEAIRARCAEAEVTLYMYLLACFQALLAKYTGQEDLVVGSPVSGRTQPELAEVIGDFVNVLAMRGRPEADKTFATYLAEVRQTTLRGFENQQFPFEELVDLVAPARDTSRNPIFVTMFTVDNAEPLDTGGATLALRPYRFAYWQAKFDLTLRVKEGRDRLSYAIEFGTRLFQEETIQRIGAHFAEVVRAFSANPARRLSDVQFLSEGECARLQEPNAAAQRSHPGRPLVHAMFSEQARRTPDHVAVTAGDRTLTYRELDHASSRVAAELRRQGVEPGEIVGLLLPRGVNVLVGMLGILKAGATYLPIDPAYPEQRIQFMLADCAARRVVTDREHATRLPAGLAATELPAEPVTTPIAAPDLVESDLAYVIFTSGSTGRPKGVTIPHRAVHNFIHGMQEAVGFPAGTVLLSSTTICFDIFVLESLLPLALGHSIVMADEAAQRSSTALLQLIAGHGVTAVQMTPSLLNAVLRDETVPDAWRSVRQILVGGEGFPFELVALARRQTSADVFNVYGPTETTVWSAVKKLDGDLISIGGPIANTTLQVLDRGRQLTAPGVAGELWIGGMGLSQGYLNRPELTHERFQPDPRAPEHHLYRTGDLARWRGGEIEVLGRADHQLKIRGFRIEPGEIEATLCQHPAVKQAVVVGRAQGAETLLCAYYVAGAATGSAELAAFLGRTHPDHMIPTRWCALDRLPQLPNGKIDRAALPDPGEAARAAVRVAPETPTEAALLPLWSDVLGHAALSVTDNFFESGGHSLKGMVLVPRMQKALGSDVSLVDLFQHPTIRRLGAVIDAKQATPLALIPRLPDAERYVATPAQRRMFALTRVAPNSVAYNMPVVRRLGGGIDPGALAAAFARLVERHDVFRTSFEADGEEVFQRIAPHADVPIEIIDDPTSSLDELVAAFVRPFAVGQAPLVRLRLVRRGPEETILLTDIHHLICDGVSLEVIGRDMAAAFAGQPWEPLPVRYRDYAAWQRGRLTGAPLAATETFWRTQFEGRSAGRGLPTDFVRPPVMDFDGRHLRLELSEELGQAIREACRRHGVTLYTYLMAAFTALLRGYSGDDDIVVGSPVSCRNHPDLQGLVGLFVNTVAVRSRLSGREPFAEFLTRTKDTVLGVLEHQDYPFERLIELTGAERDLSRNPLFDVMLVVQSATKDGVTAPPAEAKVHYETGVAKFDLTLSAFDAGGRIGLDWEYRTRLFRAETMAECHERFCVLLEAVTRNPRLAIEEISLLTPADRRRLGDDCETVTSLPFDRSADVLTLFERQALSDRCAIESAEIQVSYRELNARANRLARRLLRDGVEPGSLCALWAGRSIELITGMLAVLKLGGAYLPLDAELPPARVAAVLAESGCRVMLSDQPKIPTAARWFGLSDLPGQDEAAENLGRERAAGTPMYVIYTSGSTGRPKGVVVTDEAFLNLIHNHRATFGETAADRLSQVASPSFDAMAFELWPALTVGATLCLAPEAVRADVLGMKRWLATQRITVTFQSTAMAEALLGLPWQPGESRVRALRTAGERLRRVPAGPFPFAVYNLYGPTEDAVWSTTHRVEREIDGRELGSNIGRPIGNKRAEILDGAGRPVAPGLRGEICLSGAGLALGYLNDPELTARKFQATPSGRRYHTGDAGRWNRNGELEFLDRVDRQVKVRGYRIELGEIEATLLAHPSVARAAAVVQDRGGMLALIAFVVRQPGAADADLAGWLQQQLPAFQRPEAIVELPDFPTTTNGKTDLKRLAAMTVGAAGTGEEYEAPATPTEERIAAIWSRTLKRERIGARDNFFRLGGNSLKLVQVQAEVLREFGREVEVVKLFSAPTLRELAGLLETPEAKPAVVRTQSAARHQGRQLQAQLQRRRERKPGGVA